MQENKSFLFVSKF